MFLDDAHSGRSPLESAKRALRRVPGYIADKLETWVDEAVKKSVLTGFRSGGL